MRIIVEDWEAIEDELSTMEARIEQDDGSTLEIFNLNGYFLAKSEWQDGSGIQAITGDASWSSHGGDADNLANFVEGKVSVQKRNALRNPMFAAIQFCPANSSHLPVTELDWREASIDGSTITKRFVIEGVAPWTAIVEVDPTHRHRIRNWERHDDGKLTFKGSCEYGDSEIVPIVVEGTGLKGETTTWMISKARPCSLTVADFQPRSFKIQGLPINHRFPLRRMAMVLGILGLSAIAIAAATFKRRT